MMWNGGSREESKLGVLPGYSAQPHESGVSHSLRKLEDAAKGLAPFLRWSNNDGEPTQSISLNAACSKEEDTWSYRCRCSFQLCRDEQGKFHYAMRQNRQVVLLGTKVFPIATHRIQSAMECMLDEVLNHEDSTRNNFLRMNLTSASFASSWRDDPEADCFVVLHYDRPLLLFQGEWLKQAKEACRRLRLTQLTGRSRKKLLRATDSDNFIRDTVWLWRSSSDTSDWNVRVALDPPSAAAFPYSCVPVFYEKPEIAFFHPNAKVMEMALEWLLTRVAKIAHDGVNHHPCRLLEMYCGCGAHTMALAKSGLLHEIVAVEMDQRLVEAFELNLKRNQLSQEIPAAGTQVRVIRADASEWARRFKSKNSMDILLVDPPRIGLDEHVRQMAIHDDSCRHILYISCGREALVRDLERLTPYFDVLACKQLDLFPRTNGIETLVHLERRSNEVELQEV